MNNFVLWCKRRNAPGYQWVCMSYTERSYSDCVHLKHYYEGEWPIYEYCIRQVGAPSPDTPQVYNVDTKQQLV